MAEWIKAPTLPPREGGGGGSDPSKGGFGIDSFFTHLFHIVHFTLQSLYFKFRLLGFFHILIITQQPQTGLISRFYRQVENRLKKVYVPR